MTTPVGNNSVFRSFFEKQKLTGPNFIYWYRQLRLVLSTENKENYLEHPISAAHVALPRQKGSEKPKNKPHKAAKEGHGKGKGKMGYAPNNVPFAPKPKTPPPPCKGCHLPLIYLKELALQGLRGSKKLKPRALSLYVGDGHRATVEAIRTYHLDLPNVLVIILNNCHYAPSITRVSKNNLVYFMDVPQDGIFEIDMSCSNTNDSSIRYGYVYLLKHKHEMFETFKVFQKEVENQLGKTIKSLRSDHGGEYMSQEFLDHLKEHGIIAYHTPHYTPQKNDTSLDHEEDDQEIDEPQSDITPIRRFIRTRHPTDGLCLYIDAEEHELGDLGEPANYKAALLDPESKKWLDAMNVEMQSMKDNDVWVLFELPPNARTFGSKWLFKKKTDMNGAVYVFKARLVAKGFTQTYGVDYEETFSPVADIRAIRILIAIAAYYDYEIWKMDVKIAFLNGHLFEEVYMEQPEGGTAYILRIKIYCDRSKRLIGLCQSAYIKKILKTYYMKNSKLETIPMQEKLKLSKSQGASTPTEKQRLQNVPYTSVIGSIMYAVRCTRHDVAFAQNITSQFQYNPGEEHWIAVKNILKYLRNTKDMFLVYGCNMVRELRVFCYTEVGYLTDADDLRSQTGYVIVLNGEVAWIRKFIFGLGIVLKIEEPISMYCDNTGAIAIGKDDGVTKGARHFSVKVYYLRETIKLGDVKIEKIDTDDNLADPFTKVLAFPKHSELTKNIRMLPASSFM
nr:hypothetical protein [Tanacetum cinerariifolium]